MSVYMSGKFLIFAISQFVTKEQSWKIAIGVLHSGNWGGSFDFGFLLFFDLIKCVLKENEQKSTFS